MAAACDEVGDEERQRSEQHDDERNEPVVPNHKRKRADYRYDAAE